MPNPLRSEITYATTYGLFHLYNVKLSHKVYWDITILMTQPPSQQLLYWHNKFKLQTHYKLKPNSPQKIGQKKFVKFEAVVEQYIPLNEI